MKTAMTKKIAIAQLLIHIAMVACYGQIAITEVTCICSPGTPGRVSLSAQGTAGPFRFVWSGPGGYISYNQNPTNITTPGQYTVSVTNAYGCAVILQSSVPACAPMELQGDIQGGK